MEALDTLDGHAALWWRRLDGDTVRCELCPHYCRLDNGAFGSCGMRQNREGELVTLNYGLISSVALDPIEKKPLSAFHPGSTILSLGGFGCNLHCPFCQNSDISIEFDASLLGGRRLMPDQVARLAKREVASGNIGVAYTYNEPLIAYEYVYDCARRIHESDLLNVLVTNGYINTEPLDELLPLIDAMNIDLKGFSADFYRGVGGNLNVVKETIERAVEQCHVEVTTLVIEDENTDDIIAIAQWLATMDPTIVLHLSRFFPQHLYRDRLATSRETMRTLAQQARRFLPTVVLGNMG
jgi:pyruvate formate lyase activating enzyme